MIEKTVPLSRQYEAHNEIFSEVVVREPRFADLLALGEPYEMQRSPAGGQIVIENTEVVADYVRRCVVKPGFDKLAALGIVDSRRVREAVLDFFTPGGPPKSV